MEGCTWQIFVGKPASGPYDPSHPVGSKSVTGPRPSAREDGKKELVL